MRDGWPKVLSDRPLNSLPLTAEDAALDAAEGDIA